MTSFLFSHLCRIFMSLMGLWPFVFFPNGLFYFCELTVVVNFAISESRLEQESGFFFNMRYFEDMVTGGEWDEVEKYLSGFTKVDDNRYSMKIFFEIRKQKYLEALDR